MTEPTEDEADKLVEWAKRTEPLVEYLPGLWMTPTQAWAKCSGGPVLQTDTARDLANQLERLARTLREAVEIPETF